MFRALGADLVTNDLVAVIELVKNAYDAYATEVDVRFGSTPNGIDYIEVQDNGSGMSREVIVDAWCTVATPYRLDNPLVHRPGHRGRRTSGAKGLGRLSAARLGSKLEMFTKKKGDVCWKVEVDWSGLANSTDLAACVALISESEESLFAESGTLIRITNLRTSWDDVMIDDLRENLARLMLPFQSSEDFKIRLTWGSSKEPISIEAPQFLKHPKYTITGKVDPSGAITYTYVFSAIKGAGKRRRKGRLSWEQVKDGSDEPSIKQLVNPGCGPFSFEIRAWDIAPQDTLEIADRFNLRRSSVRGHIRAYKGISVYRDGVLVLPKSEGARDWLGLDLRRVGRVGPRLSTPQIVGNVTISADQNPRIEDTSDRERLAATIEVTAFEELLRTVVYVLENERDKDRRQPAGEKRLTELFGKLYAQQLVEGVAAVAQEGGSAEEALPLVREFSYELDQAREELATRFVYYSRLATVGTIAQMLVHEVRNRTTIIAHALESVRKAISDHSAGESARHRIDLASKAVAALDRLADTFAPLANRSFRRRMRSAVVEKSVLRCLAMLAVDLKTKKIVVSAPTQSISEVSVDPGELDAVLLNLLTNAVYWLTQVPEDKRRIAVRLSKIQEGQRIKVAVHDSGPGVPDADEERIFWPGVTNKPGGIGMGLTVASELIAEYGGRLALAKPGKLGGATFFFDLPVKLA